MKNQNRILQALKSKGYSHMKGQTEYARYLMKQVDKDWYDDWSKALKEARRQYSKEDSQFLKFIETLEPISKDSSNENIKKNSADIVTTKRKETVASTIDGHGIKLNRAPSLSPSTIALYEEAVRDGVFEGTIDEFLDVMTAEGCRAKLGYEPIIQRKLIDNRSEVSIKKNNNGNNQSTDFKDFFNRLLQQKQQRLQLKMLEMEAEELRIELERRELENELKRAKLRRGLFDDYNNNNGKDSIVVNWKNQQIALSPSEFIEFVKATKDFEENDSNSNEPMVPYTFPNGVTKKIPLSAFISLKESRGNRFSSSNELKELRNELKALREENARMKEEQLLKKIENLENSLQHFARKDPLEDILTWQQRIAAAQQAFGMDQSRGRKTLAEHQMEMDMKKLDTTLNLLTGEIKNLHDKTNLILSSSGVQKWLNKKLNPEEEGIEEKYSEEQLRALQESLKEYEDEEKIDIQTM